jgi:uncharacterized pyridoxamine 5'-phosphate oxidase family protein
MIFMQIGKRNVEIRRYVGEEKNDFFLVRDCDNPDVYGQGSTLTEAKNLYFVSAHLHKLDLLVAGFQP